MSRRVSDSKCFLFCGSEAYYDKTSENTISEAVFKKKDAILKEKKKKRKKGKIVLIVIIIIIVVIFIAAIFGDDSSNSSSSEEVTSSQEKNKSSNSNKKNNNSSDTSDEDDGQVVYEDDVLKATFKKVKDVSGNLGFIFLLENKSDAEITVYAVDTSVNDAMVTFASGTPATIQAGKHMTQTWIANPELVGIESVSEITSFELSFSYDDLESQTETIVINLD